MRPARTIWAPLAGGLTLAACAYFNGLYNANRLAGEARRAEREGRTGEARALWAQAAVRAESVAVRYPESGYRDDALLLWGDALRRIGDCRRAVEPYAITVDSSPDPGLVRRARLGLGECYVRTRRPDSVALVLGSLAADTTTPQADTAAYWLGRAALLAGEPVRAAEVLEQSRHPEAAFYLARALLGAGDPARAAEALERRVAGPFLETEWRAVLDSLARSDPDAAGRLVDRLLERRGLTSGQRARLLVDDGERWMARSAFQPAAPRFRRAMEVAPDSADGQVGRVRLAQITLRGADDLGAIAQAFAEVRTAAGTSGRALQVAQLPLQLLRRVNGAVERGEGPLADVLRFVAGEVLRDSLHAPGLASEMFLLVGREHPESLLAPKALLAAAALDPAIADSVRSALAQRYPTSPYTLAVAGDRSPQLVAVEDSVRVLLSRARGVVDRPTEVEVREREAGERRRPE